MKVCISGQSYQGSGRALEEYCPVLANRAITLKVDRRRRDWIGALYTALSDQAEKIIRLALGIPPEIEIDLRGEAWWIEPDYGCGSLTINARVARRRITTTPAYSFARAPITIEFRLV
jgi:hypothetical protein